MIYDTMADETVVLTEDSNSIISSNYRVSDSNSSTPVKNGSVQELGSLTAGVGLGVLGFYASVPIEFTGTAIGVTLFGVGGMKWFNNTKLKDAENQLLTAEELSAAFQRTHPREISQADEFTASVWQRIRDHLRFALKSEGLASYPSVSKSEIQHLRNILDEEIPKLRRLASQSHFGSKK